MRIHRRCEWDSIPWPKTKEGKRLRVYFEETCASMVENADTEVCILQVDHLFLPITVNEREYSSSYVHSIYSMFLYAEEEMKRYRHHFLRVCLSPVLALLKALLRLGKVNQNVIVNNWLLSTNLYPKITEAQLQRMIEGIKKAFPNHAILFRSLNSSIEVDLKSHLARIGGKFLPSRSIYIFRPNNDLALSAKQRRDIRNDRKLLGLEGIQEMAHGDFQISDASQIKKLYDLLYMEKYSKYNPAFTLRFFEKAIQEDTFILKGIRYKGELVGVSGYFSEKGVMTNPILGYDTSLPQSLGLYRMLSAQIQRTSIETGMILHLSSGAGIFKRNRGGVQELESMVVLDGHLPKFRRALWTLLSVFLRHVGARVLRKH